MASLITVFLAFLLINFHFSKTFCQMAIEEVDDGEDDSLENLDENFSEEVDVPAQRQVIIAHKNKNKKKNRKKPPLIILPSTDDDNDGPIAYPTQFRRKFKKRIKEPKVGIILPKSKDRRQFSIIKEVGVGGGIREDRRYVGSGGGGCNIFTELARTADGTICFMKNKARELVDVALS